MFPEGVRCNLKISVFKKTSFKISFVLSLPPETWSKLVELFGAFLFCVFLKRMLQRCLAVKLQKRSVDVGEQITRFLFLWGELFL